MTQEHPITPPPELVQKWSTASPVQSNDENWAYEMFIAHHAAQWGADQELEACCEYVYERLKVTTVARIAQELRAARRPKPPSLKKQALLVLDDANLDAAHHNILLRALEQLDD
jgi:hypothetical protein